MILFGQSHHKFWNTVLEVLKPLSQLKRYLEQNKKFKSFAAGAGTVLFYEDQSVIKSLQEQFELYADNFPIWSEHSTAIAQFSLECIS